MAAACFNADVTENIKSSLQLLFSVRDLKVKSEKATNAEGSVAHIS